MQRDFSGNTGVDESLTPQVWQSNLLYTKGSVSGLLNLEQIDEQEPSNDPEVVSEEASVEGTTETMAVGERYNYTFHSDQDPNNRFHLSVLDFTVTEINEEEGRVSFELHSFTDAKGEVLDLAGIEKNRQRWEEEFYKSSVNNMENFELQTASEAVTDEVLAEEETEIDTSTEYDEAGMQDLSNLTPKGRQRKTEGKRNLEESDEKGPINNEMDKEKDDLENCD